MKVGEKVLENLSINQANSLFKYAAVDFKKGKLTLDELSVIGSHIFHEVAKNHRSSELFQVTLLVSELNFAIRSPAVYDNIPMYLGEIDKFLQKDNKD